MPTDPITLAQLTTVGGIAVATSLLDKLLWSAVPSVDTTRFGPIVAVATGLVVAVVASLTLGLGGKDLAQAIINGVVGGLSAAGLYDVVASKAGLSK